MMRAVFAALPFLFVLAGNATPPPPAPAPAITGLWVARLEHDGEQRDFYLKFVESNGTLRASFSIPEIGAENSPLGPAKPNETSVELPAIGWTLKRDGARLIGTIPHDLLPHYDVVGRFERTAALPPADLPVVPAGRAPAAIWETRVNGPIYAGLAFDKQRKQVLVGTTAGTLVALAGDDGRIIWTTDLAGPIRATALVSGTSIYVPTDGALHKIDAMTGARLWSAPFGKPKAEALDAATNATSRWDVYSSSAVEAGPNLIVGSRDGCVHVIESATGDEKRKACSDDIVTSTPVVRGDRIYFGSFDGKVYAVRLSDGSIAWRHDTHGPVVGDLAFSGRSVLAGSRSYDLLSLNPESGQPGWRRYFWFSWVESSPSIVNGRIYIGSSDSRRIFALSGDSGKTLWASRVPGWAWPRPTVLNGTVYAGVIGTDRPYVGRRAGGLAAIDRANGRLKWMIEAPIPKDAMFYGFASAPVAAGNRVFAADLSGRVIAIPAG